MLASTQTLDPFRRNAYERGLRVSIRSGLLFLGVIPLQIVWLAGCALLGFVSFGFFLAGKDIGAERILIIFSIYGFLIPAALVIITCMVMQVVARVLWLSVADGIAGVFLGAWAIAGRLALIFAIAYLWGRSGSLLHRLFLPIVLVCSVIAWIGYLADLRFLRIIGYLQMASETQASVTQFTQFERPNHEVSDLPASNANRFAALLESLFSYRAGSAWLRKHKKAYMAAAILSIFVVIESIVTSTPNRISVLFIVAPIILLAVQILPPGYTSRKATKTIA